jgi:hypothetical protein
MARYRGENFFLSLLGPHPSFDLGPLAGFQILIVLEEVQNALQGKFGQIIRLLNMPLNADQRIDWYGDHFLVATGLVGHFQHTHGAAAHHHSSHQRHRRNGQYIQRDCRSFFYARPM